MSIRSLESEKAKDRDKAPMPSRSIFDSDSVPNMSCYARCNGIQLLVFVENLSSRAFFERSRCATPGGNITPPSAWIFPCGCICL